MSDVAAYNRKAWDRLADRGNTWTRPVSDTQIDQARQGNWSVVLTPLKPVPRDWFGDLAGRRILGLASGGGQQGPILAAAGASVIILDNSPAQLERDRELARRHSLDLATELGLMQDLSRFPDGSFDIVFNPVSNCFVPELQPIWNEAYRVLAPGGRLLTGFCNPVLFGFDPEASGSEGLQWKYRLPYSDLESRSAEDLARHQAANEPLEFSHSLEAQIGGQLEAGFRLVSLYEDTAEDWPLAEYFPPFLATLSAKP